MANTMIIPNTHSSSSREMLTSQQRWLTNPPHLSITHYVIVLAKAYSKYYYYHTWYSHSILREMCIWQFIFDVVKLCCQDNAVPVNMWRLCACSHIGRAMTCSQWELWHFSENRYIIQHLHYSHMLSPCQKTSCDPHMTSQHYQILR